MEVDKAAAHRFSVPTDAQENASGSMTYQLGSLSDGNTYYLVGNPYMATLSMYKFFKANPGLESLFYTYADGKIKFYDSLDLSLSTYDSQNDVTIVPMQAFFVRVADGQQLDKLHFSSSMTIDREMYGAATIPMMARYELTPSRGNSTDGISELDVLPASGSVAVYTMDGKLLYQAQSESLESVMQRMPSGWYIVQIRTTDGECHSVKIGVK